MTPAEIIAAIREGQEILDKAAVELAKAARAEALARVKYKRTWAKSYLAAIGAVKKRETEADVAAGTEFDAWVLAEAIYKSSTAAWNTARDQLSALQSIASTVREEMRLAR